MAEECTSRIYIQGKGRNDKFVDDCPVIDKWFTEYENLLTTLGIKDNNWACSLPIATPAYLHPHIGAAIKRMADRLVSDGKDAWPCTQ